MKKTDLLKPEESEIATLRQAVEWVAFKLPPLTDAFDKVFRSEGSTRLMYCEDNTDRYCNITEAHQKLFIALRKGLLPATAAAIDEIEQANYHEDIPDFRKIKNVSGSTEIACTVWEFNKIFWSESCLAYDDPDTDNTKSTNNGWLLARCIWVDTAKLYALFPPEKNDTVPVNLTLDASDAKTYTGDPGRPAKGAHLYEAEFLRRCETGNIATTLAQQAKDLLLWLKDTHPDISHPTVKSIENRIRAAYKRAKNKQR